MKTRISLYAFLSCLLTNFVFAQNTEKKIERHWHKADSVSGMKKKSKAPKITTSKTVVKPPTRKPNHS